MTWAESAMWIVLFLCLTLLCLTGRCGPPNPATFTVTPTHAEAGP